MGTGVFQLARTKGACACSDHDDVEVQSFMCGTKYWGKGASTNAAIAVRVQNFTFVISAQDDVLSVSGSEDAVLAPVDEELERALSNPPPPLEQRQAALGMMSALDGP